MKPMLILAPYRMASIATSAGPYASDAGGPVANLYTPDPREVFVQNGGGVVNIDVDLGAVQQVDTIYIGYVGGTVFPNVNISGGKSGYGPSDLDTTVTNPPATFLLNSAVANPLFRHMVVQIPNAAPARYVRISFNSGVNAPITIGAIAIGQRFVPQFGVEYGAGRPIIDVGDVERLFSGSFGINVGAVVGGYSFTLGDLQPAEREALFRILRSVGLSRPVLVIENSDPADMTTEGVHWGLFRKIDTYERLDALNTKWAMTVEDWL